MQIPRIGSQVAVTLLAVLVGAATTAGAAAERPAASRAAESLAASTFVDPAADAQGGPDVRAVAVTGDASTRMVGVAVTVPGWQAPPGEGLEVDREAWVWIDSDRNRATGDPEDGTEYGMAAWNDSSGEWWTVERWNGDAWQSIVRSPTMGWICSNDVLTWVVSASDLGGATDFRFYVVAGVWSWAAEDWTAEDRAPDGGWWEYTVPWTESPSSAPPAPRVRLAVSPPATTPLQPVAGKRLIVTFPVAFETETSVVWVNPLSGETTTFTTPVWAPVPGGTMVCDPWIGGKVIRHAESFRAGRARLSFVIPRTSKGRLRVRVTLTATERTTGRTVSASRIATFPVA